MFAPLDREFRERRERGVVLHHARVTWSRRRSLYWPAAVRRLMREIERELISTFGPARPTVVKAGELSIEEAFISCEFGFESEHCSGIGELALRFRERGNGRTAGFFEVA